MIIYQALAFLIITLGTWLASWVYLANRKSRVNQIFSLFTVSFLLWAPLPYFFNLPSLSQFALPLVKSGYGIVSLFLVIFYFFIVYFPRKDKRYPILDKIVIFIGALLFLLSILTNLVVERVEFTRWGVNPIFGTGKLFYFGSVFFLALIIISSLFKKYFTLSVKQKLKAQYIFVGLIIFIIPNLIFNVIFPFLGKTSQVRYYPFGNYSAIFLLGFTAYAIVKRELFGIKLVLTTLLVSLIAILLLFDIFILTQDLLTQLFKGLLLAIFLYFGYLLIRSVLKEIALRVELEKAYKELKKLDVAKSEFISIASHQLRTPLTAIKGYISLIREKVYGTAPERMERPLDNIYISAERLIKLVNELLNISRIEAGKIKLNLEELSLDNIINEVVKELENIAKEKRVYLKWHKPKRAAPLILLDRAKIRQVILNVIDNAIRYTQKGGVTIKTKVKDKKCQIEVKDTGEGMTRDEISGLFKTFARGTAGQRSWTEGVGLGLYIAKKFVEMHKGKIWAKSKGRGKGSTFYIELPIRSSEEVLS